MLVVQVCTCYAVLCCRKVPEDMVSGWVAYRLYKFTGSIVANSSVGEKPKQVASRRSPHVCPICTGTLLGVCMVMGPRPRTRPLRLNDQRKTIWEVVKTDPHTGEPGINCDDLKHMLKGALYSYRDPSIECLNKCKIHGIVFSAEALWCRSRMSLAETQYYASNEHF